jgi:hypothetical protein
MALYQNSRKRNYWFDKLFYSLLIEMKNPVKPNGDKAKPFASKRRAFATGPNRNNAAPFATAKKAVENPFDKFANSRKKHEVLNRRVKGEDRNVGRAREKVCYAV